jgi:hypothetical protein
MGYSIKVQKVERPTNRSYYINLPVVLAEAVNVKKGEQWEWTAKDQDTLILSRVRSEKKRRAASSR